MKLGHLLEQTLPSSMLVPGQWQLVLPIGILCTGGKCRNMHSSTVLHHLLSWSAAAKLQATRRYNLLHGCSQQQHLHV